MKIRSDCWLSLRTLCLALLAIFCSTAAMSGQEGPALSEERSATAQESITVGPAQITGLPEDWTHHHVVFSNPGTEQEALNNGTYDKWLKVVNDPRYILQQLKQRATVQGPAADDVSRIEQMYRTDVQEGLGNIGPRIHADWSMDMGSGAKVGAGMYPAKYSFNGSPECGNTTSPDFVAYNTGLAGATTQASIVAYYNLYTSCSAQVPSVYWAFNTGGTISTSVVFSGSGSQLAFVQAPSTGNAQLVLLKWAATPAGRSVTGSVMNGSTDFSLSVGTLTNQDVGAGISGGGIPAGDTIASITSSTAGTLFTAANGTHSGETLAITADAGVPDTLTAVTNANYPTCTAPCMTTLSFSGSSRTDAISSPFYDYGHDALYVGDASGGLHKFQPVFNGTPAEVGTPWATPSSTALSSPIYDSNSERVFVGDASGFLYAVNTSATVTKSFQVAVAPGITDGPLVDSSAEQVYAFVSEDLNDSNSGNSPCNGAGMGALACNGVIQLPASFTATTEFTESVMGVHTTNVIYIGALDNQYWNSGTGNLYVNASNGTELPKLMEIPITTAGFSTAACQTGTGTLTNCSSLQCARNVDNPMTSAAAASSPVTEIFNTGTSTDWIFTSVSANGNVPITSGGNACTGACVYSFNVTTTLPNCGLSTCTEADAANGLSATGGTSGIIIDNTSATSGASQIYFSPLSNQSCATSGGTGGCAVQASQSEL